MEFTSNNIDHLRPDNHIQRKNSSILSTANRNYMQINTPSALGYTSVLFPGTNTGGQRVMHFYPENLEDPEQLA